MHHVRNDISNATESRLMAQRAAAMIDVNKQKIQLSKAVETLLTSIHSCAFDPTVNIKVLKSRCNLHDNNISLRFHLECGTTIKHYLDEIRMRTACALLRETDLPVWAVAESVGYQHLQTFYRTFARLACCTPVAYKNAGLAGPAHQSCNKSKIELSLRSKIRKG